METTRLKNFIGL